MLNDVLNYFPETIKGMIDLYFKSYLEKQDFIEEIRIRIYQNLMLKIGQDKVVLNYKITKEDMQDTFENICEKSVYSYTKQISEGFITIKGGNRVGIVGTAVIDNGKIINLNDISSLNFRIAREVKGSANPILKDVIDMENNSIFNTLIVSPPGCGKTTVLRDLTRQLSNRSSRNWIFTKNMWNCG